MDIITRPVRRALEDEIERLIAMLDEMDGDCDAEEEPDAEWSFDSPYEREYDPAEFEDTDCDDEDPHDQEDIDDREHDTADEEPTLGWTNFEVAYCRHTSTLDPDMEEQCEDEGADRDDAEPLLGWPENDGIPVACSHAGAYDDGEVLSW